MTDYRDLYLNDAEFHAACDIGAQVIIKWQQRRSVINQGPTNSDWDFAMEMSFAIMKELHQAGALKKKPNNCLLCGRDRDTECAC